MVGEGTQAGILGAQNRVDIHVHADFSWACRLFASISVVSWRLPHVAPLYAAVDVACVRNALGGEAQLNVREHVL
jgi:hypothetical protein